MNRIFLSIFVLLFPLLLLSQEFTIKNSQEFENRRSESVPDLIGVDNSGMYFISFTEKRKYLSQDHSDETYTLTKYDLSFNEVFSYKYKENLKGSEINNFLLLKGNLYIFTYLHDYKEKKYTIFGGIINKETGKIENELKELLSFNLYSKKEDYPYFSAYPSSDSSGIIIDASHKTSQKKLFNQYYLVKASMNLTPLKKLSLPGENEKEILYHKTLLETGENINILLFQNKEKEKPSRKISFGFSNSNEKKTDTSLLNYFTIKGYNNNGGNLYTVKIGSENQNIITGQTAIINNKVFFAGFYCTSKNRDVINGILLNQYDALTGKIIKSSVKQFIPTAPEASSNNKDFKKEESGLPKFFRLRSISINPKTSNPIIIAEYFLGSSYSSSSSGARDSKISYTTYFTFVNSDLLIMETDENLQFTRTTALPKMQIQKLNLSGYYGSLDEEYEVAPSIGYSGKGADYYSSFQKFIYNDKMLILLNDNPKNEKLIKEGTEAQKADNLSTSTTFILTYDFTKGEFVRKALFNNTGKPIPLVKDAILIGNDIYLHARLPHLLGRSDYKIIKITIK